jgi:hypothetical protein
VFPVYLSFNFSFFLACFLFLGYHQKSQFVRQEELLGGLVRRYAPLSKYQAGVTTCSARVMEINDRMGNVAVFLIYKSSGWQACALVFASRLLLQNSGSFSTESVEVLATDSRRISTTGQIA